MEEFKGIVKSEILWVQYIINNFPLYIMTSDRNRTIYYLYKYSEKDNKYIKTNHQSQDPIKLEEKYVKYNSSEIIKSKSTENKKEINIDVDKKVQEKTEKIITPIENNNKNKEEKISIKDSNNSTPSVSTSTGKRRGRPPKNKTEMVETKEIKESKTIIHDTNVNSIKPPENSINTAFSKVVDNSKPKPKPKKGRLF